ncbi:MAG TPA: hydrogenase small subunit [Peptococcaceae bacterium]|nr:hydrogenase small subunit [Peptococcaceae bacterium]
MPESYYQWAMKKGITRREFLKFCTAMAAMLGLEASMVPKIVHALETNPRVPVIYLNLQECTCCSESLLRAGHPLAADLILNMISLDYMEVLQAAAGEQAEEAKLKTMKEFHNKYLLVVEGSVSLAEDGVYCTIGGRTTADVLQEAAEGALAVIAYGTCATDGCVQGAYPNPTKAVGIHEVVKNKPVIKVPGCPPIAEVITGTIVHYLTFGVLPELTPQGRPKAFYQHTIHDNCNRRAFFDKGLFVESFDDPGAREGWCLFKIGCKGPSTYNACAITGWNEGTSYPIKSGHPCLGCSEDKFFDKGSFYSPMDKVLPEPSVEDINRINKNKVIIGVAAGAAAGAVGGGVATAAFLANRKDKKLYIDPEDFYKIKNQDQNQSE